MQGGGDGRLQEQCKQEVEAHRGGKGGQHRQARRWKRSNRRAGKRIVKEFTCPQAVVGTLQSWSMAGPPFQAGRNAEHLNGSFGRLSCLGHCCAC